jgi:cell division protein FtsW
MAVGITLENVLGPERRGSDRLLSSGLFLVAGTGFAALWSASTGYAISIGKPSWWFALRQLAFYVPALGLFALAAFTPLEAIRKRVGLLTIIGLASLLLPFMPVIGEHRNGASRWIDLGFTTLQPSEFWKPLSVIYLAHVLDRRGGRIVTERGSLLAPFLLVGLGAFLIYVQNDFSTAAIAIVAAGAVFWVAGASIGLFAGIGAAGVSLAALVVLTSDFRLKRILTFLFPSYEPHGQGYQLLGSLRALREGGFFGKGLGLGTLKLGSIPEVQSDFIFASWTEETGFVGVLAFFGLWALVAARAFRLAFATTDNFRSWLGFGLAFLLVFQVLINTAVAAGVVPATGIALPFFSAGGSSLMASAGIAGLLVNLGRGGGEDSRRSSMHGHSETVEGAHG